MNGNMGRFAGAFYQCAALRQEATKKLIVFLLY
jgi:hypothetical protein